MTAKNAEPLSDSFKPLTENQGRTLKAIKELRDLHDLFPTYEEIASELGIAPSSAYDAVGVLIKKGYIKKKEKRKSRSLEIVFYPFIEKVSQEEKDEITM